MASWCLAFKNKITNQITLVGDPEQLALRPELRSRAFPCSFIEITEAVLGPEIESHVLPFTTINDEPDFGGHEFTKQCYCQPRLNRAENGDICWLHRDGKPN